MIIARFQFGPEDAALVLTVEMRAANVYAVVQTIDDVVQSRELFASAAVAFDHVAKVVPDLLAEFAQPLIDSERDCQRCAGFLLDGVVFHDPKCPEAAK